MGFAQGAAIGQRAREQTHPMMNVGGAVNPQALQGMVGSPVVKAPQMQRGGGGARRELNPSAIHRRAAELTLQEQELKNQELALQVEELKEANKIQGDERRRAIEREPFEKSQMIEGQYQDRLGSIAAGEAMDRGRHEDRRGDDYKAALFAAHVGNPEPVMNYVNEYGNPDARIESVDFAPDGSGELIITYPGGGKEFYKSPEDFFKGFLFWMGPDAEKAMASKKGISVKDRHSIMSGLEKSYDDQFKDPGGHLLPDAPDRDTWLAEKYKERTGEDWALDQKQGAVTRPGAAPGEPPPNTVRGPDGKLYEQGADGRWYLWEQGGESAEEGFTRERVRPGTKSERDNWDIGAAQKTAVQETLDRLKGHERVRAPMPKRPTGEAGHPPSETPERQERHTSGGTASATYTDPKTGERVTVTYDRSGKRTEKREKIDKDKKSKKRD